jgi:uncharacterized protein
MALRWLAERPKRVLAVVLAVTALLSAPLVDWRTGEIRAAIETDVDRILPRTGTERGLYDRFLERFGHDDWVVAALLVDDVFAPENLARLQRMTQRLAELDGVKRVSSLANTRDVQRVEGQVVVRPLYETPPVEPAALAALRRAALGNPFLVGNLVSRDGSAAVVVVEPEPMSEREFLRRGLDREIERVAHEAAGGQRVVVAGPPIVKAVTARLLVRDLWLVGPGTFLFMAVVALLTFRSARGVLVPMASLAVAQLWTIGIVVWSGRSLTLVTSVVPPLVNTVGFAYVVHVVAEYDAVLRGRGARAGPDGVAVALGRVSFPVFMCALTTAIGCLSLCTSLLPVIREFGVFSAVGVASAFVASMTVAPALLALFPSPPGSVADDRSPQPLEGLAQRIAAFDVRHSGAILLGTAVLALVALAALPRIRVSTSLVSNFREGDTIREGIDAFDRMFDGSMTLRAVIEGGSRDAFKEPANLRVLEATQRWIEAQPEVGGTTSLADHVKTVSRAFRGGDTDAFAIPESRRLVAQLLHFLWDERLESMVDRRFEAAAILVRAPYADSREVSALIERIEAHLRELPPPLTGYVTGNTAMIVRTIDRIAISQALNLATASVSIGLLLVVYFRSVRLGLLALIPNLLPVLAFFAALGLSGITLNVTTSLIATIVLGVAVDDTIHFLVRYDWLARTFQDAEKGAVLALRTVARPVSSTNLALILGFLVLATSHLKHQVEFGVLASGTLAFGWLMDLFLTPALAYRFGVPAERRWGRVGASGEEAP